MLSRGRRCWQQAPSLSGCEVPCYPMLPADIGYSNSTSSILGGGGRNAQGTCLLRDHGEGDRDRHTEKQARRKPQGKATDSPHPRAQVPVHHSAPLLFPSSLPLPARFHQTHLGHCCPIPQQSNFVLKQRESGPPLVGLCRVCPRPSPHTWRKPSRVETLPVRWNLGEGSDSPAQGDSCGSPRVALCKESAREDRLHRTRVWDRMPPQGCSKWDCQGHKGCRWEPG